MDIDDQFAKLPSNLVLDEHSVDDIISKMKDLILSSESMKELKYISNDLYMAFKESKTLLQSTDSYGEISADIDSALYTEPQYTPVLKLWADFPDTLIRTTSKKMYEFMEKLWIPVTMYRLLSNLEDTIISSNVTARSSWVDGAREIILHSILVDENNPEATLALDEELTDSERRAVRTIQARLLEFPIIFDNMNVSNRDLQNFRLLLDPVWYHAFMTKILSKKALT